MGDDEALRDALNAPHLDVLVDSCIDVVEAIRAGSMPERGRKVLLDALGHSDCVSKGRLDRALDAAETYLNRAECAEAERDEARTTIRTLLDEIKRLREALRPFSDLATHCDSYGIRESALVSVTSLFRARAALSADADADAEPPREDCCRAKAPTPGGRHQEGERWTCSTCGRGWIHVIEESEGCWWEPEPSRAEGDAHAFAPVDTPDAVDPHTCHRCGEGRFHPSHLDPREGLDPDERMEGDDDA